MAMVLERGSDAGTAADLRRELIAAGFVIERWGDGAQLVLSPSPLPSPLHAFGQATPRPGGEVPLS